MARTVLSDKGQVVIPAEVRTRLGLRRGDRFEVELTDEGIVFKLLPRSPLSALYGAFKGDNSLTEELIREHERDREREDAR